ncbi:MAG: hypothetical protein QG673_1413 [Pseudomonadota bacterium]|nr:hypothetical protein [Pseudomonadota bacterium]
MLNITNLSNRPRFFVGGNKMIHKKNERIAEAASESVEHAKEFLQTSISGIEKIAKLQLDSSKAMLEKTSQALKEMSQATDPKDFFTRISQLATNSVESNICNCKEMYEILSEVQNNVGKLIEHHLHNTQQHIADAVDGLSKYSPAAAHNNGASESIKSWIDNTNQAINTMQNMAHQITDFTTKNIKAATEASVNASKRATAKK